METDQTQFLQTQRDKTPVYKLYSAFKHKMLRVYTKIPWTNLRKRGFQFPNIVPNCAWRYTSPNMNGVWQILHNIDNIKYDAFACPKYFLF